LLCYTAPGSGAQLYVGSSHDDFISYSLNALDQYSKKFGYTSLSGWSSLPSFGSGQIVKLFSFNNSNNAGFPDATGGTGDNQKTSPTGDQTAKNDHLYYGVWPTGSTTVTVADLKAFLGSGNNSPVFAFDLNNNNSLDLNGFLTISTAGGDLLDTFSLDNMVNHAYDTDSFVTALLSQTVQWYDPLNQSNGCNFGGDGMCTMSVDNNVGSGKPDFFAYAYNFDLTQYNDSDVLSFALRMKGLNAGGEELALTNVITPPDKVPEPGALSLLGLGLMGLAYSRRKSGKA
jgi:PEP-CTERM motif